jgi:predicted metal-dependent phosphoesterase TrpH
MELDAAIVARYAQVHSIKQIALEFRLSPQHVGEVLRAAGVVIDSEPGRERSSAGRSRASTSDRGVKVTLSLRPHERDALLTIGDGSMSRGVRRLLAEHGNG